MTWGPFAVRCFAVAGALGFVALIFISRGGGMFSPGELNGVEKGRSLGGVMSHAGTAGQCSACHAPPWSSESMADRCLNCHADIRGQIDSRAPIHGRMTNALNCSDCHREHQGPRGALTDYSMFDHDCAAFKLTGRHLGIACVDCHREGAYQGTVQACVGCHAEPASHVGKFGTDCARCHQTTGWGGATFAHRFPLNHGVGRHHQSACVVCHQVAGDYAIYTCYGCHKHEQTKMEEKHAKKGMFQISDCARCHPTGREHDSRAGERFRR
jgi:hypothetical protein